MNVLIFEFSGGGHRLQFVGAMLPAFSQLDMKITLSLPATAIQSPSFEQHVKPFLRENICISCIPTAQDKGVNQGSMLVRSLLEEITRHNPQRVYLPDGDGVLQALMLRKLLFRKCWARGIAVEALLLNGKVAYRHLSLKDKLKSKLSSYLATRMPICRIHHLDPFAVAKINQTASKRRRVWLMPEPVEPKLSLSMRAARAKLSISDDSRVLGMLGMIDERKGADLFLEAAQLMELRSADRLLIIGAMNSSIKKLLATTCTSLRNGAKIIANDGFVTDEELHTAILATDVIAAPYRNTTASSGIVTRSILYGKPIVGSNSGWLGNMIEQFQIGYGCDVSNRQELALTMSKALDGASQFKQSESAIRLTAFHTIENYRAHWASDVRAQLGLPAAEGFVPWDWVLAG